jgi:hypothetical protein
MLVLLTGDPKCHVQMVLCGIIYIQSFIKIVSGIQKLIGGDTHTDIQTQTHRRQGDLISTLLSFFFFQNK